MQGLSKLLAFMTIQADVLLQGMCFRTGLDPRVTSHPAPLLRSECFNQSDCTQRNPVLSQLQGELCRNPFRHRSHRTLHSHVKVSSPLKHQ